MKDRWENYKKLEALSENIPEPNNCDRLFVRCLRGLRQSLANTLVKSLSCEQQIEHAERCLKLDGFNSPQKTRIGDFMLEGKSGKSKQKAIALLTGDTTESQANQSKPVGWKWFH
jgi:hypothetical protein